MSKAFTREDDAGLEPEKPPRPAPVRHASTPMGHAMLASQLEGARQAGDRVGVTTLESRLAAGTIPPPEDAGVAGLGAEIVLRDGRGRERVVRLVTVDEVGLVPRGASPASPLGAAVLGARVGDEVELDAEERTVVKIAWPRRV